MTPSRVLSLQVKAALEIAKVLSLREISGQVKRFGRNSTHACDNCVLCTKFYLAYPDCPKCVYGEIGPLSSAPEVAGQVRCFRFGAAILGKSVLSKSDDGHPTGLFTDNARQLLLERYCMAWFIKKGENHD